MSIVQFLNRVNQLILNPVILLAFAVSFIYFIYGIIKFLSVDAGDEGQSRAEYQRSIFWGIIGMAIMFSVYGIIKIVLATFGVSTSTPGANYLFP